MNNIFLISCVKSKNDYSTTAALLYKGSFYSKMLHYAKKQTSKDIFILSAKYGLLLLDEIVDPYEQTLNSMKKHERVQWSQKVIEKLSQHTNLAEDHFILLAGNKYRENILPHMSHYSIPMKGMRIGQQLQWLIHNG